MTNIGRIPPQSIEAEQSFLGSLLIDKEAFLRVEDLVTPEDFYRQAHADIFSAMVDLMGNHEPIDLLTLANRLTEKGRLEAVGGRAYLIELTTAVPTSAHVAHYGQIIQKKATLRRLLTASSDITSFAFDESEDVDDVMNRAEQALFAISQKNHRKFFVSVKEALGETFERLDELQKTKGSLRGIPTGFTDLDAYLGGLQKSDLIILAARPSVGKSSFAMDIARQAAVKYNVPVGVFALEMSYGQLTERMLCAESGVDLWKLRHGKLNDDGTGSNDYARIGNAAGKLSEAPIFIDDTSNLSIVEVRTKARRLKMEHGLGLLVIDYLQLMEGRPGNKSSDNRVNEVSEISRGLKTLARELNIPILALSQLSRGAENIKPAIPRLSHLRESGAIEQDADIVMFIYRKSRDSNYRPDEIPLEERHTAQVIIAKHRNGPVGEVNLFFDDATASFKNLDKRQNAFAPVLATAAAGAGGAPGAPQPPGGPQF